MIASVRPMFMYYLLRYVFGPFIEGYMLHRFLVFLFKTVWPEVI
jgi:hypothetical protein